MSIEWDNTPNFKRIRLYFIYSANKQDASNRAQEMRVAREKMSIEKYESSTRDNKCSFFANFKSEVWNYEPICEFSN